jgi:hypothetical protein
MFSSLIFRSLLQIKYVQGSRGLNDVTKESVKNAHYWYWLPCVLFVFLTCPAIPGVLPSIISFIGSAVDIRVLWFAWVISMVSILVSLAIFYVLHSRQIDRILRENSETYRDNTARLWDAVSFRPRASFLMLLKGIFVLLFCLVAICKGLNPSTETFSVDAWIVVAVVTFLLIYGAEYEWVVRPQLWNRDDKVLDPHERPNWHEKSSNESNSDSLEYHRNLAFLTFHWLFFKYWMPSLTATVNLGFDSLDQRGIIHGMLVSLREAYHQTYLSEFSIHTWFRRGVLAVILLVLTNITSNFLFDIRHPILPDGESRCEEKTAAEQTRIGRTACAKDLEPEKITVTTKSLSGSKYLLNAGAGKVEPVNEVKVTEETTQSYMGELFAGFLQFSYKGLFPLHHGNNEKLLNTLTCRYALEFDRRREPFLPYYRYIGQNLESTSNISDMLLSGTMKTATDRSILEKKHFSCPIKISAKTFENLELTEEPQLAKYSGANLKDIRERTTPTESESSPESPFSTTCTRYGCFSEISIELEKTYIDYSFNIHHLAIYAILSLILLLITKRSRFYPHNTNIGRMDNLLESLTSRVEAHRSRKMWAPAAWIQGIYNQHKEETVETNPADPRAVELAFMTMLEDIVGTKSNIYRGLGLRLSSSTPEVTFIFDELDKLSGRSEILNDSADAWLIEGEISSAERKRSLAMHKMLSDLKQIISKSPARFIFVGGRLLHDEWLADMTSRRPLLTSIFDNEIYLPSLLTDLTDRGPGKTESGKIRGYRFSDRIFEYLGRQHIRSEANFRHWFSKRWKPIYGLRRRAISGGNFPGFVPEDFKKPADWLKHVEVMSAVHPDPYGPKVSNIVVLDGNPKNNLPTPAQRNWKKWFLRDFVSYLTYRSAGNPKRLNELLSSFTRPVGRAIKSSEIRWRNYQCEDVLNFSDDDIFRIQLIRGVYIQLVDTFEERLVVQDDKAAISLFHTADFLFKFHGRAFTWENLERIEDLTHIHRSPEIRQLVKEIVRCLSGHYLHEVLNGMYSFRFKGEMTAEISFISRVSETELAAFNFTLDESKSLKALYHSILEGENQKEDIEVISALGELYEYDQAFDEARQHFRRAIASLDDNLEKRFGFDRSNNESDSPVRVQIISDILSNKSNWLADAPAVLSWGTRRLRIMLQIALTHEISQNLDGAEVEYREASQLAYALIRGYLIKTPFGDDAKRAMGEQIKLASIHSDNSDVVKHLNILFQPMLASAWLAEKFIGGGDTAPHILENNLQRIYGMLPFICKAKLPEANSATDVGHSNFSLVASELHQKSGNLYFFKGKQKPSVEPDEEPFDGYLQKAHFHYATSLHHLNRYIRYRLESSAKKFALDEKKSTFQSDHWPPFVYLSTAGGLADLADGILARLQTNSLLESILENDIFNPDTEFGEADWDGFVTWMETLNSTRALSANYLTGAAEMGLFKDWFGTWNENGDASEEPPLIFDKRSDAPKSFFAFIELTRLSAKCLEKGGHPEDAGEELLRLVESILRIVSWLRWQLDGDRKSKLHASDTERRRFAVFSDRISQLSLMLIKRAARYFQFSRRQVLGGKHLPIGRSIPPKAITLIGECGLIAESRKEKNDALITIRNWTGNTYQDWSYSKSDDQVLLDKYLRQTIINGIRLHRFPALNRLNALKLLIDHSDQRSYLEITEPGETMQCTRSEVDPKTLISWGFELDAMAEKYHAPLRFTPVNSGFAYFQIFKMLEKLECTQFDRDKFRFALWANREIFRSTEMYTLGPAYRENISSLYYLYDDFNDRHLHNSHAVQMAGAELASGIRSDLDNLDMDRIFDDEEV